MKHQQASVLIRSLSGSKSEFNFTSRSGCTQVWQQVVLHPWEDTLWAWAGREKWGSQSERGSVPGWKLSLCPSSLLGSHLQAHHSPIRSPCRLSAAYKHTCKGLVAQALWRSYVSTGTAHWYSRPSPKCLLQYYHAYEAVLSGVNRGFLLTEILIISPALNKWLCA